MLRRYKDGELQRLLFGNKLQLCATMRGAVKRDIPVEMVSKAVSAMLTTRVFSTLGAKYLWAYLKMTNFIPESHITNKDFLIFAITLRIQLSVTAKTIKRYIIEAHKAILAAGHKPDHPRRSGVLSIVHGLPIPIGGQCRRRLDYCGIKWQHIKLWRGEIEYPTQQDQIALTIISVAFTTLRRVGTFVPSSRRQEQKFSWILPKFVRYFEDTDTLLI